MKPLPGQGSRVSGFSPLVRWLYTLCFPVVFVFLLPGYLRRMFRRGNFRQNFGQRLGFYSDEVSTRLAAAPGRMWLQAVSVGETLIALKLVDALREKEPGLPLILSTTTTTGYKLACDRAGTRVEVVYTPIDLRGAVRRAFEALNPGQIVIVDGGLWPNLLWEARQRNLPTALVNARLSPRSELRFRRLRFVASAMFQLLDLVCVCETEDLARWQQLGVPADRLRYTGSIKFDDATAKRPAANAPNELCDFLDNLGISAADPVFLAGSTHPGEEAMLAQVFLRLRNDFPALRFFVAPRHVERAREVCAELEAMGLKVLSRTEALTRSLSPSSPPPFDVLLLDTTGELREWYATGTVVFIGKSLAAIGGQNPAEAIAAGRPVILGPHMENFRDLVAQLLHANAAVQVPDLTALEAACRRLLADPTERTRLAEAALRCLTAHRGAAARTAELLLEQVKFSTCQPR